MTEPGLGLFSVVEDLDVVEEGGPGVVAAARDPCHPAQGLDWVLVSVSGDEPEAA